jgi:site-specific DNA-methyltransferase (adenine-specific)
MAGYMQDSKFQEWETPQALFDRLNRFFHFTVDLACNERNAKCKNFFSGNSLSETWEGRGWLNPPYGASPDGSRMEDWIGKAFESVESGRAELITCLIPASTETAFWFKYCWKARHLIFLKGRIRFELNGRQAGSSPKGSALVVFSKSFISGIESLEDLGKIISL